MRSNARNFNRLYTLALVLGCLVLLIFMGYQQSDSTQSHASSTDEPLFLTPQRLSEAEQLRARCVSSRQARIGCELALSYLRAKALIGISHDEIGMAMLYINGWFKGPDRYAKAEKWLLKASDGGNAHSQYWLAILYAAGPAKVERDLSKSMTYLVNSIENGSHDAGQFYGGHKSFENRHLDDTLKHHIDKLYQSASRDANVESQFQLALAYNRAIGVQRNDAKAFEWMQRAAAQGHAYAQLNLGNMYYHGVGVNKNKQQALLWISKAVEQEHAYAQYVMGLIYLDGELVKKDVNKSVELFRASHKAGIHQASISLANLYMTGDGVRQNVKKAQKMQMIAADKLAADKSISQLVKLF